MKLTDVRLRIESLENDIKFYENRQRKKDTPFVRSKLHSLKHRLIHENYELERYESKNSNAG